MDPVSGLLAGATFVSLAKDVTCITKVVIDFLHDVHHAPQILQEFHHQLEILRLLVQQLAAKTCDNELMGLVAHDLSYKVNTLKALVAKLDKRRTPRLPIAANHHKLKQLSQAVDTAKLSALLAHQILLPAEISAQIAWSMQQVDTLRLPHPYEHSMYKKSPYQDDQLITRKTPPSDRFCRKKTSRVLLQLSFNNRLWKLTTNKVIDSWSFNLSLNLRVVTFVNDTSAIAKAICAGELCEVKALFEQGAAHPYTMVKTHDRHVSLMQYAMINFDSRTPEDFLELCNIFVRVPQVMEDLEMVRDCIGGSPLSARRVMSPLLVLNSDIDLLVDWPNKDTLDNHFLWWFLKPNFVFWPMLDAIYKRQITFAAGHHFRDCAELLQVDPRRMRDLNLPAFLILHQIRWSYAEWPSLSQELKDWMLHAAIYRHDVDAARSIMLAGADPFARIFERSALDAVFESCDLTKGWNWTWRGNEVFAWWYDLLAELGIDVQAYMDHENASPRVVCIDLLGHTVSIQEVSLHGFTVRVHWAWPIREQLHLPGSWPDDDSLYHAAFLTIGRQKQKYNKLITFTASETTLCAKLGGYSVLPAQDDHSLVYRSWLRSRHVSRRRSISQPRSLQGKTWKLRATGQSWTNHCHKCPFDGLIHYTNIDASNSSFMADLSNCHRGHLGPDEQRYEDLDVCIAELGLAHRKLRDGFAAAQTLQ